MNIFWLLFFIIPTISSGCIDKEKQCRKSNATKPCVGFYTKFFDGNDYYCCDNDKICGTIINFGCKPINNFKDIDCETDFCASPIKKGDSNQQFAVKEKESYKACDKPSHCSTDETCELASNSNCGVDEVQKYCFRKKSNNFERYKNGFLNMSTLEAFPFAFVYRDEVDTNQRIEDQLDLLPIDYNSGNRAMKKCSKNKDCGEDNFCGKAFNDKSEMFCYYRPFVPRRRFAEWKHSIQPDSVELSLCSDIKSCKGKNEECFEHGRIIKSHYSFCLEKRNNNLENGADASMIFIIIFSVIVAISLVGFISVVIWVWVDTKFLNGKGKENMEEIVEEPAETDTDIDKLKGE
ncbi:unnamed protein product [Caenorhabditis angaria]|uniref:Domain of unknown function DX domain-containing protein n=1 Tax=Caenorhabditis angaria TaxID=860376 RepID=A0A9P1I5S3_9PELO|nr:unnamed protein product [Caenorhabditis angaria]